MKMLSRIAAALALSVLPASLFAQTTRVVSSGQSIQTAIDASATGDIVQVNAGTYTEHLVITGKAITLTAATGVTLSPGTAGPAITISGAAAFDTVVNGFTITGAGKPTTTSGPQGGIFIQSASPTIKNSTLTTNYCAGIRAMNSTPTILNNKISGTLNDSSCTAGQGRGSAITISGSDPSAVGTASTLSNNTITGNISSVSYSPSGNSALLAGGAAININAATAALISYNDIHGNTSTGYGGAFYMDTTPGLTFVNNLVYGNKGLSGGLDIVIPTTGGTGEIANNTIADNNATSSNAGTDVYIGGNLSRYEFVNNIVAGYSSGQATIACGSVSSSATPMVVNDNDLYSFTSTAAIASSCTPFTLASNGNPNLSVNPLFVAGTAANVTAGTANFQLQSTSPLLDKGNNSIYNTFLSVVSTPVLDIAGNPRFSSLSSSPSSLIIDMGAYEAQPLSAIVVPRYLVDTELSPSTYTPTIGQNLTLTVNDIHSDGSSTTADIATFYQDNVLIGTSTVSSSGVATYTFAFPSGTHRYYANSGNSTANSNSFDLVLLGKAAVLSNTTTTLVAAPNPATAGQTVLLTATVAPVNGSVPPGTMYFIDGNNALGNSPVNTTSGTATYSGTFTVGTHSLTAAFVPTDTTLFNGSTGSTTLVVNGAAATATIAISPTGTLNAGDTVTLTSTVSGAGGVPTGTVTFFGDGNNLGTGTLSTIVGSTTSASTQITPAALSAGTHAFGCTYNGDGIYAGVQCAPTLTVVVNPGASTTTLTSSTSPAQALALFSVFAKVVDASSNPIAGAAVTLHQSNGADQLASTNASGIATFSVASPVSSVTFSAVTTAGTSYASSTSASVIVPILPNATTGTMIASPTSAYEGQTVSVVVSILNTSSAVTAAGTVSLYDGTTLLSTQNLPTSVVGQSLTSVTFSVTTLLAASHSLSAVYNPTVNFLATTSAIPGVSVTINPSNFTLTPDTSITIQTEHHKSMSVTVTSVGNFSGPIQLSFVGTLPPVLTPTFGRNPVILPANGSVSTTINLETDAIANFYAFLPFALLPLALRKRFRKVMLAAIFTLAALIPLSGCSGHYPNHTPPGTYILTLQGTGTGPGGASVTQTAYVKLIVTQ